MASRVATEAEPTCGRSTALSSATAIAAEVPEKQAIVQKLKAGIPSLQVESIVATPVKGVYQLETSTGELLLISSDGSYLISGDLHQVQPGGGVVNLTEKRRSEQRLAAMKDLKLPHAGGVDLVRSIRKLDGGRLPIVVFSGTISAPALEATACARYLADVRKPSCAGPA